MNEFNDPNARWVAVQSRDPLASSSFIYSVKTTKIYCRPTCPSRCARRANVMFHDDAAAAEADGFRACKRCRPDVLECDGEGEKQRNTIGKACDLLSHELVQGKKWPVKNLAAEVGLTESHFCRVFKKIMGMTVGDYRAKILLAAQRKSQNSTNCTFENDYRSLGQAMGFNEPQQADVNRLTWDSGNNEKTPNLDLLPESNLCDFNRSEIDLHEALEKLATPYPSTVYDLYLEDDGLQFFDFTLLSQDRLDE